MTRLDVQGTTDGKATVETTVPKREYDKRTIFVPQESKQGFFRTSDKQAYRRGKDGVIRKVK
jgi:hypothetical protein